MKNKSLYRQLLDYQRNNCTHRHHNRQYCMWCAVAFVAKEIEDARQEQGEAQHSGCEAGGQGTANTTKATTCQLITDDILNYLVRESLIDRCNDDCDDVRNSIFSIIDGKL